MKRLMLVSGSIIVLLAMLFIPYVTQAQQDQSYQLETYMGDALETYKIPGASLGVIQNGEVVFKQSFGEQSDGSPVKENTLFSLGSLSKPLTSLGILTLVEKGKIELDAPIDTYLSFDYGQSNNEDRITIRQLLSHTSGISSFAGMTVADQNLRGRNAISEAVEELDPVTLEATPGEVHQYSAANYLLLGKIIEEVTSLSFAEYMQREVFASLGMDHTVAMYKSAKQLEYQPGFQSWFGQPVRSDVWFDDSGAPYGYMASTLDDMIVFLKALQSGGLLLSEPNASLYLAPEVHRKDDLYYGLGWRVNDNESDRFVFHGGETPDSRAELFFHQTEDYAFVLLTNKNNFSEVMHTIHIKDGIRSIIENQEMTPLPKSNYQMQWLTLLATVVTGILVMLNMARLYRKNILRNKVWFVVSIFSIVLAAVLIPLFVSIFQVPWHFIQAYAPETAFLITLLVGVIATNGIGTFVLLKWKKKSSRLTEAVVNEERYSE
ncbi:serine hydrolase domain-containing protein [Guptibacillus algicola]|uniref:serine hydrolase domain-containing protein n=1 Tax=Guptibacillus algicola TaxID=225844 RepID=UPI001CD7FD6A|nr:serine hydrolase domain-containing protein [Alkalihalobacillus algicola]MCA0987375.1 beta-lactamase family protein [Alkalihalobacillus algicola]